MTDRLHIGIIKSASEIIEKFGWIQEKFGDHNSGFCTMGAIIEATGIWYSTYQQSVVDGLTEWLQGEVDYEFRDIPSWNDAPERTKEDVTLTLKHYAHYLEGKFTDHDGLSHPTSETILSM